MLDQEEEKEKDEDEKKKKQGEQMGETRNDEGQQECGGRGGVGGQQVRVSAEGMEGGS